VATLVVGWTNIVDCKSVFLFLPPGPDPLAQDRLIRNHGMDPHVIIDAIAAVMGNEEKELCAQGNASIALMLKLSTMILGTKERVCFHVFLERYFILLLVIISTGTGSSHHVTRMQSIIDHILFTALKQCWTVPRTC